MQKKTVIGVKPSNLIVVILGGLAGIGPFTIDMYIPGFPAIAQEFQTDIAKVSLTLTSYFIGLSMGQLLVGPMLDRFGRKKPMITGLIIYILSAVGCAFSQSIYALIIMRFFLAMGVCVGMAGSNSMVRDLFTGREVARAMSLFGMIFAIAPVVAPTIGGIVVASLGWRYVFAVLIILVSIMLFSFKKLIPETKEPDSAVSLRPKNVLIGYMAVIRERQFVIFVLSNLASGIGLFSFITSSPFVFINIYGFTAAQFGWIFGANAVVLIIAGQLNRILLKKYESIQILIAVTLMASVIGIIFIACSLFNYLPIALLFVLMAFYWLSFGFTPANSGALALHPFSGNIGRAAALMGSIQMLSGAIASGLVSVLHDGTSHPMLYIMAACAFISLGLFITGSRIISVKNTSL